MKEFNFEREVIPGLHDIAVTANFDIDNNINNLSKAKYTPFNHGICSVQFSNIIYNTDETHFILTTPDKENLLDTGVLIEDKENLDELLEPENVNYDILATYLRRVADKCKIPATCLLSISNKTNKPCIGIYNISERHCVNKPSKFLAEVRKKKKANSQYHNKNNNRNNNISSSNIIIIIIIIEVIIIVVV